MGTAASKARLRRSERTSICSTERRSRARPMRRASRCDGKKSSEPRAPSEKSWKTRGMRGATLSQPAGALDPARSGSSAEFTHLVCESGLSQVHLRSTSTCGDEESGANLFDKPTHATLRWVRAVSGSSQAWRPANWLAFCYPLFDLGLERLSLPARFANEQGMAQRLNPALKKHAIGRTSENRRQRIRSLSLLSTAGWSRLRAAELTVPKSMPILRATRRRYPDYRPSVEVQAGLDELRAHLQSPGVDRPSTAEVARDARRADSG